VAADALKRRPAVAGLAAAVFLLAAATLTPVLAQRPLAPMPGARPAPGEYMRYRLVRVFDEHGFHEPIEAYRFLVPSDWQVQTWLRWRPDIVYCPGNPIDGGGRLLAPDGITGMEFFPAAVWQWVDDPQNRQVLQQGSRTCPWLSVFTAPDYLRQALPRARPGAQLVSAVPDQPLSAAIDAQVRTSLGPLLQAGYLRGLTVDAGRFHLVYQMGGRPVEEQVSGVLKIITTQSPSYSQLAGGGGGPATQYSIIADPWIAARALQGQLPQWMPVFATVVGSIAPNLQWLHAVQTVSSNIANIQRQGAMDRARIWRQAQQEISQIYSQAWQQQQRVQSGLARQYSESLRGVETYVDRISGERVELTGGYQTAWSNGRGEYILSNSPNFNPAIAFGERWEEMPRAGRQ
jgi:hypothetical protein